MTSRTTYRDVIDRAIAWAVVFHGSSTLKDVVDLGVARLVREIGHHSALEHVQLVEIPSQALTRYTIGEAFSQFFESLEARRREIMLRRVFSDTPESLTAIAEEFGVTRERVRQLEADALAKMQSTVGELLRRAAACLERAVGQVARKEELMHSAGRLVMDAPPATRSLAVRAIFSYSDYRFGDRLAFLGAFNEELDRLRREAEALADPWGLLDEQELRPAFPALPDDLWELVVDQVGLVWVSRYLASKATNRTRTAAALREIGGAATVEDIATHAGLSVRQVAPILSATDGFVRITKDTWGFSSWTDDPYEGVVQEILERILEGGGEASVEDLVQDIPSRFGVTENTVRVYLATDKFLVENGTVRIAETIPLTLRPLQALEQLVWDDGGRPFLKVDVHEQHLRGNSIKVPPEVASHLGVRPDERASVLVRVPDVPGTASVIWRSYDPSGPEIGRLRTAFEKLNLGAGDQVFLLLDRTGLEVWRDGTSLSPWSATNTHGSMTRSPSDGADLPPSSAMAVAKLKSRRRVF